MNRRKSWSDAAAAHRRLARVCVALTAGLLAAAAAAGAAAAPAPADGGWTMAGQNAAQQRFSPLQSINRSNVSQLGLAWYHATGTRRGLEATPVVVNGVLYTTLTWSRVEAFSAVTGKLLWRYDPKVPRSRGVYFCCDAVNRGVAVANGKVFLGTLDGRLIALDATTGKPLWSVVTVDQSKPYSITGVPHVIDGNVIIGNGGAEYAGVRGYVTAYRQTDGKQIWRFYTVPGDPTQNTGSPALQAAAKTWSKPGWWRLGGGGPVWNAMAYDPKLGLLYIGTGNANPWNRYVRNGDNGHGDNLYTASIVALNAQTGRYVWHFQTTPGDSWDYDSDEDLVLADLRLKGVETPVILQANKNGFFYVLNRKTGAFISANNFVQQNWAKSLDPKTGRPTFVSDIYNGEKGRVTWPAPFGGHNWQPDAFSPQTGYVYIPAQDVPFMYARAKLPFVVRQPAWDTGLNIAAQAFPAGMDPLLQRALFKSAATGKLIAWDPVTQSAAWSVQYPMPWNGGTLATAGGLVFQGTADGYFDAYDAKTGKRLWHYKLPNGVIAAPMTYQIAGTQYVALMMGWGGSLALSGGVAAKVPGRDYAGYLLVFKLGGNQTLPPPHPEHYGIPNPPPSSATDAQIAAGNHFYNQHCAVCHGANAVSGSAIPDLRYLPAAMYHGGFKAVVLGGALTNAGMVSFANVATPTDADNVKAYLIKRAQETRSSMTQPGWWADTKSFVYRLVAPLLAWLNAVTH
ncbi:MAG TPA: PQQ-dependent dehydrogenase, methanol/ethanol family [Nevskiaceae bacterium]|nr:PQQ-dependent dehydrogenase, methanol/ethanol family [Nevskiaceae bacterium]